MNKLLRGTFLVGAALCAAAPALAADMAPSYKAAPMPAPVAVYNWTGFYIGANVGGAWERESSQLVVVNDPVNYFAALAVPGVNASGSQSLSRSGFTGGGQVGYNLQTGQWVWGIEADINGIAGKANRGGTFLFTTNNAPYVLTESASADWLFTLRGRVGWAMDRGLLYFTGGLAVTDRKFDQFFSEPPNTLTISSSKIQVGFSVGGGYEYAFTRNWSVKAEYLYSQFGGLTAAGHLLIPGGRGATFNNSLGNLDIHMARVGVNYHFGGPVVANY
jgi:outer membrane immunogenic protein